MLDVTDIVNDPDFATTFKLRHVTGAFTSDGTWNSDEDPVECTGIVLPAKWDQLLLLPEGERQNQTIVVYCSQEITLGNRETTQADIIEWDGQFYRVVYVKQYQQASVWFAMAARFYRAS
jgi:hypothetical protein